jgi:hypothetical protein
MNHQALIGETQKIKQKQAQNTRPPGTKQCTRED